MKRIQLQNHLSVNELEQLYRNESDAIKRSHWQIIWLLAQGHTPAEVAQVTAYTKGWIYILIRRYNAEGVAGVGDRRHANPGQAALLTPALRAELEVLLTQAAPDGGFWTGPKVARWMSEKLGRTIHPQRGNEVLHLIGYRSYVPRPHHVKADPLAQEDFKKRSCPKP